MIRQNWFDKLMKLFFALNTLRNICLFFAFSEFATILFYCTYIAFAGIICLAIIAVIHKPIKVNGYMFSSILLTLLLFIIPFFYDKSIWTSNSYIPLSFLMTMLFIIVSRNIIVKENTIIFCYKTIILQAIIAIVCSFFSSSYEYGSLVLNMGNPNQTAILLSTSFSFCFLFWIKDKENKSHAISLWSLMIGLMVLIFLTDSRTAILSCVICCGGYICVKKRKSFPLLLQWILLLTPIILPLVILLLLNILPSNIMVFGKLIFSGREQIWKNILDTFIDNPFSHHLDASPFYSNIIQNSQEIVKGWGAHNGILAVQWYYGIVVLTLIVRVFASHISDIKKYASINYNSYMVYIVILALIFSLSFEEGILMGNICTTMVLGMFFLIGRSEAFNE